MITVAGRHSWGCGWRAGEPEAPLSLSSNRVLYVCVCVHVRTWVCICVDFLQATCLEQISCTEALERLAIFAQLQGSPRISCVTSQVKQAGGGSSQQRVKANGGCLCVRKGESSPSALLPCDPWQFCVPS